MVVAPGLFLIGRVFGEPEPRDLYFCDVTDEPPRPNLGHPLRVVDSNFFPTEEKEKKEIRIQFSPTHQCTRKQTNEHVKQRYNETLV